MIVFLQLQMIIIIKEWESQPTEWQRWQSGIFGACFE